MVRVICFLLIFVPNPSVFANSSTAGFSNEGLRLLKNDRVKIAKEDLFISAKTIRIQYEFENVSDTAFKSLIAFPFPKVEVGHDTDVSEASDFKVKVGERPLTTEKKVVYTLNKKEIQSEKEFRKLFAEEVKRIGESAESIDATSQVFHTWTQEFPARGKIQVDISYSPSVGSDMGWDKDTFDSPRSTKTYCIDAGTKKALQKVLTKIETENPNPMGTEQSGSYFQTVSYILKTANNWAGPIGDFRLTIEKPDPKVIISLCMAGLRKVGPTRFEVVKKHFRPTHDLDIAFFHP